MGNPLLDIQVKDGEGLLKKYNLKANDAILADEKHLPMFDIPHLPFLQVLHVHSIIVTMRSSRNIKWSTSPVVQRRMLLGVQQYVSRSPYYPILVPLTSFSLPQYVLPPNSVVYTGCVGDDDLAQQLKDANKKEGLAEAYLVKKGEQTGACAVVITGHHRYFNTDMYTPPRLLTANPRSGLSSPLFAPQRNLTKPTCQLRRSRA